MTSFARYQAWYLRGVMLVAATGNAGEATFILHSGLSGGTPPLWTIVIAASAFLESLALILITIGWEKEWLAAPLGSTNPLLEEVEDGS